MLDQAVVIASLVSTELLIFAGVGFLIGGASDLLVDIVWMVRGAWRRLIVYRRYARASALSFDHVGRHSIAVFIPAWKEADVIGAMLGHAVATLGSSDWRIIVGTYPNDADTAAAACAVCDPRVTVVTGSRPGPTTKADCLNVIWRGLLALEAEGGWHADAVVLHDAEDVVHPDEISIYDMLIGRFDLVQIPVVPLVDTASRWISGHYNDEFAESHGRTLVVREALGAAIPAAGVGCAFSRRVLDDIAQGTPNGPFNSDSLTEDYELGLRIRQRGGRNAFVRLPVKPGGAIVAVHAHFPATINAAVRQKARWIAGIALTGWDRLGWSGSAADNWMRLHDRRAPISALVLLAAYVGFVLTLAVAALRLAGATATEPLLSPSVERLLVVSSLLLAWRLALRAILVSRTYGWREGLRSTPRSVVANVIAIMATYRAAGLYWRMRRDRTVIWDKTAHRFPELPGA